MIITSEEINKIKLQSQINRIKNVMKSALSKEDKEYHMNRIKQLKTTNKLSKSEIRRRLKILKELQKKEYSEYREVNIIKLRKIKNE